MMSNTDLKYTLVMHYGYPEMQSLSRKGSLKMHFAALGEAYEKLLDFDLPVFQKGIRQTERHYINRGDTVTGMVIIGPQGKELEVKVQPLLPGQPQNIPGIYFHFPKGIRNFEQQTGEDLSDFKGYDPENQSLLVGYLLQEVGRTLEPSMAFARRVKSLRVSGSRIPEYVVGLTTRHFGCPNSPRSVSLHTSQEFYYHKDPVQAVRQLLSLNFNRLREDIAWENDEPCFHPSADLYYKMPHNVLRLAAAGNSDPPRVGPYEVTEKGIHLHTSSTAFDMVLPWEKFKKVSQTAKVFQVGTLNDKGTAFQKVPELSRMLAVQPRQRKKNTSRKNRPS